MNESQGRGLLARTLDWLRPGPRGLLSRDEVVEIYRRRAPHYNVAVQLYRLFGFRLARYREMAVDALGVSEGDTVVEVCCGTGENFPLIRERIGASGRLIGVDLTDAMLDEARRRIERQGWSNVELVHGDVGDYEFPEGVRGILSTLALPLSPDYDDVIAHGAEALAPGGRWVLLELQEPEGWPPWAVELALLTMSPYGVTLEAGRRHPWESLRRHLPHTWTRELFFGAVCLSVGGEGALEPYSSRGSRWSCPWLLAGGPRPIGCARAGIHQT